MAAARWRILRPVVGSDASVIPPDDSTTGPDAASSETVWSGLSTMIRTAQPGEQPRGLRLAPVVRPTSRPGPIGPRRRPVPPTVADERRRAAHTRRRHGSRSRSQDLAQAKNFAALTTLMPDGHPRPRSWVGADDEHVIINTQLDRQKYRNVLADPRVTVTVFDADNPYRYVEARGRARAPRTALAARPASTSCRGSSPAGTTAWGRRTVVILFVDVERVHKNG